MRKNVPSPYFFFLKKLAPNNIQDTASKNKGVYRINNLWLYIYKTRCFPEYCYATTENPSPPGLPQDNGLDKATQS